MSTRAPEAATADTGRANIAWKVLTASEFAQFRTDGSTAGAPNDRADGYIHLSIWSQLEETLARHFAEQTDLYLVGVDLAALGPLIRWESSRGGALFPHLYAALSQSVILAAGPLTRDDDGVLTMPSATGLPD